MRKETEHQTMNVVKNVIKNIVGWGWFFCVVIWMLFMILITLLILPSDINVMIESGFAGPTMGFTFLMIYGFVFGITMLVPAFRICFKKLPWLYPFIIFSMMNMFILAVAEELVKYGYQVQNDTRHIILITLMIMQVIGCRIGMSIYCHKKNMRIGRDEYEK